MHEVLGLRLLSTIHLGPTPLRKCYSTSGRRRGWGECGSGESASGARAGRGSLPPPDKLQVSCNFHDL